MRSKGSKSKAKKLTIAWTKPPSKVAREIIPPASSSSVIKQQPIAANTRIRVVKAIAQGRHWLDELVEGNLTSVEDIAQREKCTARQVNLMISLAFLSPRLVIAAVEGRLPRGIGISTLRDLPPEWEKQHSALGLAF